MKSGVGSRPHGPGTWDLPNPDDPVAEVATLERYSSGRAASVVLAPSQFGHRVNM
jgi:hypothetical protein